MLTTQRVIRRRNLQKQTRRVFVANMRNMPAVRTAFRRQLAPAATRGFFPRRPNALEKKVQDIAVTTYQINTTGSFTLLSNPVLGSDFNARIGRKIMNKSIYIRGFVGSEAGISAAGTVQNVSSMELRMILFVDLQPNGAVPVVTDLLNTASPASHLNLNNRDRFRILKDKVYVTDPYILSTTATQSVASAANQVKQVKVFKGIRQETTFNATNGGTIADINSGALYMFWIGNNAAGTNTDGNAVVGTRVRYTDG